MGSADPGGRHARRTPAPSADLDELRERLDRAGAASLTTPECLALAIRQGAGRAAPGWAERLLARFGSLPELLGASAAALAREAPAGIVRDLQVLHDLQRRALLEPLADRPVLQGFEAVADYLRLVMGTEGREQLRVLHLDKGLRLIRAHLTVRALGDEGERLNPKKADLEAWRQGFARALRDHGTEAEATRRRTRGVTRKAERGPMRRMRERAESARGAMPDMRRRAYQDAARAAFGDDTAARPWEMRTAQKQAQLRALYLAQSRLLQASPAEDDQRLGRDVEAFVRSLSKPDTERLALARALRAANEQARSKGGEPDRGKDRRWRKAAVSIGLRRGTRQSA